MSIDDIVKLVEAIAKLLNVIVWPGVLTFVLIRFGRDLRMFFSSLAELTFKGVGFEASVKRQQAAASAALAAAAARSDKATNPENIAREARLAADISR